MITWHGLSDEIIFSNGTYHYYRQVLENDPNAADYYRFFPVPGVNHCAGGIGPFPDRALQSLVDWVEKGIVPEILEGTSLPDANGTVRRRPLCPYPLVAAYQVGISDEASSFKCRPSFEVEDMAGLYSD
jgi:Tannase and feruloyl esterase